MRSFLHVDSDNVFTTEAVSGVDRTKAAIVVSWAAQQQRELIPAGGCGRRSPGLPAAPISTLSKLVVRTVMILTLSKL